MRIPESYITILYSVALDVVRFKLAFLLPQHVGALRASLVDNMYCSHSYILRTAAENALAALKAGQAREPGT